MQLTVDAALRGASRTYPQRPFLRFGTGDLSFAATDRRVNSFAHGLATLGVRQGSHLAILMPNRVEFVLAWLAANRLGAAVVPVNTQFRGPALTRVLNASDAEILIADPALLGPLIAVADRLTSLRHIVLTEGLSDRSAMPTQFSVSLLSTLEHFSGMPELPEVSRPSDRALIMFTSGTTGLSKGCVLSNRFAVRQAQLLAQNYGLHERDVLYCPFPLFHLDAAILTIMPALVLGATAAIGVKFSASRFWDEVRSFRATVFDFMGATLTILHKQPARNDDLHNPVRLAWGVPVPRNAPDFEQRFGLRLVELYGSTDVGVPIYEPIDRPRRLGSCGRPIAAYDVRILDDDDEEVPTGTVGEIAVRPREPHLITDGYLDMAAETVQATRNLWWHTGDLASQDADGYIYFVGRKTDSIRRRGENISAFEVEEIVKAHTDVLDAAAYPVPSELTEDDVMVAVIPRPGHVISFQDLVNFCADHMAPYMVPRYIEIVDDLPRTPTSKISKAALVERGITASTFDRERATQ